MFIQEIAPNEESLANDCSCKHHHDVRLKSLTLESYVQCEKRIRFATFFILNAAQLQTMRIKFLRQDHFTEEFYKQKQNVL